MKLLLILLSPCFTNAQFKGDTSIRYYTMPRLAGDSTIRILHLDAKTCTIDSVFIPTFPKSHAAVKEMSDSFNINNQKALRLMRKKGCMQKTSCRDSILFYQGKSIAYLELERKFAQ